MTTETTIEVDTDGRFSSIDITDRVADAVPAGETGTCTVFVRHTTAGVSINEAEPRLLEDIEACLESVVPAEGWAHDELDGNAEAHLRTMLLGRTVTVPVTDGSLDLGPWQSVLLLDCDGPRTRSVTLVVQ